MTRFPFARACGPLGPAWIATFLFSSCSLVPRWGKEPSRPVAEPIAVAVQQSSDDRSISEARSRHVMISTQGRAATEAARTVLEKGGNIIDAAIAASFAIAVERPHSTGLGGGGFLLYREAATGKTYALDFRERAPERATRDLFLDRRGNPIPNASTEGIRSVAVPGFLKAMVELHRKFGKLPVKTLLKPAERIAADGFEIYPDLAYALREKRDLLARYPASRRIFLHRDGKPYRSGETLVQKDLARTLHQLGDADLDEWITDELNEKIVSESRRQGGILVLDDFQKYSTRWLDPIVGHYKDFQIVTMAPPSGGGTQVIETLDILSNFDLTEESAQHGRTLHLFASALQLASADRAAFLGDPAFVRVPLQKLLSARYAAQQSHRINPERHTPSVEVEAGDLSDDPESTSTTHFTIMDEFGNVVTSTQTINGHFGSGITVPGTGILLNDEMDDFSAKHGVANQYGATGGDANAIAPGKTPLSSMAPTIVLQAGKPILALGAPGGTRIPSCVSEVLMNYLEFKLPLYLAVAAVRIHHQWKPDELMIEAPGPSPEALDQLKQWGYAMRVIPDAVPCRVMAVAREDGELVGVSDPRDNGESLGL